MHCDITIQTAPFDLGAEEAALRAQAGDAGADNQNALGQLLEEERLVGCDRQLFARDVRHLRPTAGSDEDMLG